MLIRISERGAKANLPGTDRLEIKLFLNNSMDSYDILYEVILIPKKVADQKIISINVKF